MAQDATRRSPWRFFPLALAAGLCLTVAVNGAMIWQAIATFPGKAGRDGFELSNRYNMVLDRSQAQADLGWTVTAAAGPGGWTILTLTDAAGRPLPGARATATAERPLGDRRRTALTFIDHGGGRYRADRPLDLPGQWDITLDLRHGDDAVTLTRRVHVP